MRQKFLFAIAALLLAAGMASCSKKKVVYYQLETVQPNTATAVWNPADYDFETGNTFCLQTMADIMNQSGAPACSSWRNGNYHGRNLDWYQGDYGCIIMQMPKGDNVRHASVALLNVMPLVKQQTIRDGVLDEQMRALLPAMVVDGINDAGIAANINIVPHDPLKAYNEEGDLSCLCVVRYVLDNAGSVAEAIELLSHRTIAQNAVGIAGDETHYMISGKDTTAVVEFEEKEMVVTYFQRTDSGFYSMNGTPAIMTNLYDFAVERYGVGTDDFYENHPYAMGVERWNTIREQYDNAARSVEDNIAIAQSVWYFRNFMVEQKPWYSENAIPTAYGKDAEGWYYTAQGARINCADAHAAQHGYWDNNMEAYWESYENQYALVNDPHMAENHFWETSHSVVYDLEAKKGYLIPFENYYSADKAAIVFGLPE